MGEGESPLALAQSVVVLAQKALRANGAELWAPSDGALVRLAVLPADRDAVGPANEVTLALAGSEPAAQVWRDWLTVEREPSDGEIEIHFLGLTVGTERIGDEPVVRGREPALGEPVEVPAPRWRSSSTGAPPRCARSEALTDALTGVDNGAFSRRARATSCGARAPPVWRRSLLFIDIDRFSGSMRRPPRHDVVARLLRDVTRGCGASSRGRRGRTLGGDEFVVILP